MKKKELGIISILVITICLMIFSITKSNIENNNVKKIIADVEASTLVLKEDEEISLNIKLNLTDNLKDKVNIFRAALEYDKTIFNSISASDIKLNGLWSNLEFNEDTQEFIVLNLNKLSNNEDVMTITFRTRESIPSVSSTSIGLSRMETADYTSEEIIITNEDGNTLEEVILTKMKDEEETTTTSTSTTTTTSTSITKPTTNTKQTSTTKSIESTTTTIKPTTSTTSKKTEVIVIPPVTSTTTSKKITTTTNKKSTTSKKATSKKTTTKKSNTKKTTTSSTTKEEEKETTTVAATTTKESKSFFEKNNQANKKVLVIVIVVILILIALAIYRYNKFKNMNIFFIILSSILLLSSPLVKAISNLKGDVDNDGNITINDIINIEKYLINLDSIINPDNKATVDLNEDGTVSTIDLAILIHTMLEPANDDEEDTNGPTAQEVLKEIKIGWNLGNALDSTNYKKEYLGEEKNIDYYETLWGNPKTTKEMIDTVKEAGFNSIRVPVTYYDHILSDGTIDEAWFKRVEEVINYVLDNGLYCILDMHHDTGLYEGGSWIVADVGKFDENAQKVEMIWTQVANRFKDYDYKLIFEGLNETVDAAHQGYDWNSGTEITLNVLKLNQVFVDTVRSTGGKNKNRVLAVTTYGGITDEHKLSLFTMPNDIVKDKIILSVHDYADEEKNIDAMFERINKYILEKNIPIMIDEFGTQTYKGDEERARIASYYVSKAHALNIPCYIWDDGGNYQILDRNTLTWKYPKLKNALIEAVSN